MSTHVLIKFDQNESSTGRRIYNYFNKQYAVDTTGEILLTWPDVVRYIAGRGYDVKFYQDDRSYECGIIFNNDSELIMLLLKI